MPGSHPLWATFVWLIEIRVHCKNQSSSVSGIRDIDQNKARSWRGIMHTQASLRKHVISLDRVRHLISGVDHPVRLVCCPLLHAILSPDPITRPHIMSDEHNLSFLCNCFVFGLILWKCVRGQYKGHLGGLDKVFKIWDRHNRIHRQKLRPNEGLILILAQSWKFSFLRP